MEDPAEVIRIYLDKARVALSDSLIADAPPLALTLALAILIQLAEHHRRWVSGDRGGETRLAITLFTLAFIGLILAQGIAASPTRFYMMPIGPPLILVLLGLAIDNLTSMATRRFARRTA